MDVPTIIATLITVALTVGCHAGEQTTDPAGGADVRLHDVARGVQDSVQGADEVELPLGTALERCVAGCALTARETLCEPTSSTCFQPTNDCADGWCRVPAAVFRTGTTTPPQRNSQFAHVAMTLRPFVMQDHEVTQSEWMALMGPSNPSRYAACGPSCPVTSISVHDALAYANALSRSEDRDECYVLGRCDTLLAPPHGRVCKDVSYLGSSCEGYRLPSEYEWVLAASGGRPGCTAFGTARAREPFSCDTTGTEGFGAWFCGNADVDYEPCVPVSRGTYPNFEQGCVGPQPVKSKLRGPFGLYDMNGSVEELTGSDWYTGAVSPESGAVQRRDVGLDADFMNEVATRGGSFASPASSVCSWFRNVISAESPVDGPGYLGFRLVRTVGPAVR